MTNPGFVAATGGFCLVIALVLVAQVKRYLRTRQTVRWDRIKGRIIWSMIEEYFVTTNRGERRYFRPEIRFRYSLGGREYESDRIIRGQMSGGTEPEARKWFEKYPPGKEVFVYVNPLNVEEAVLVRGDPDALDRFIVLIVMLIGGGMMLWIASLG